MLRRARSTFLNSSTSNTSNGCITSKASVCGNNSTSASAVARPPKCHESLFPSKKQKHVMVKNYSEKGKSASSVWSDSLLPQEKFVNSSSLSHLNNEDSTQNDKPNRMLVQSPRIEMSPITMSTSSVQNYHDDSSMSSLKYHDYDAYNIFNSSNRQAENIEHLFTSNEFYTTMQNVLMRTNTQTETYIRIMAHLSPFASHSHSYFNGNSGRYRDNNDTMMMNCRHFSSTSGGPQSSKSDEKATVVDSDKASPVSTTTSSTSLDNKPPASLKKDLTAQEKATAMMSSMISSITSFLSKIPGVLWFYITHPKEFKEKLIELKEAAKKEAHHYYMGSKLLMADLKTARQMLLRLLNGSTLTRRERKQFIRTVTDVFRMVPMAIFVLIPFMEFALPLALKIFPNMLPSTFQDSLKNEENMKRELKSRIAMAEFFQELVLLIAS